MSVLDCGVRLTAELQGSCWLCGRWAWAVDEWGCAAHPCCVDEHARGETRCASCDIAERERQRWERKQERAS